MPFLDLDGRSLFYERGGVRGAPVLLLSCSLGTSLDMWEPQVKAFERHYDLIRYDMRGHGKSSTPPGPYSLEQLAADAIHLLEALALERVAFCGISVGGAIGQWLALHAPDRFRAFLLANTAMKIGSSDTWDRRIAAVEKHGLAGIADTIVERWFSAAFRLAEPQAFEKMRQMLAGCDPAGYVSTCMALRNMAPEIALQSIRKPVCILAGEYDPTTTIADAQFLNRHIAGSRLVVLSASHLSNLEAPVAFTDAVLTFLEEQDSDG